MDDVIRDSYLVLDLPLYLLDGQEFQSKDAYGHPCTVTDAVWRPSGRYFNNTPSFITVPHSAELKTANGTLEAFVKPDSITSSYGFMSNELGAAGAGDFYLGFDGTAIPYFGFMIDDGAEHTLASSSKPSAGQWYHVAATFGAEGMKLYIDGRPDTTDASITQGTEGNSQSILIGSRRTDKWGFDGLIGEARIYSRALTPQEIQHNYLATRWRYR